MPSSSIHFEKTLEDCPSCGAPGVGSLEGCISLFQALGEREFSNPEFYSIHRLTVDTYCLQHPEQYMISTKSASAHLAGMYWSMEIGKSLHMPAPLKNRVNGPKKYARVTPPNFLQRGTKTIVDVVDAENFVEYEQKVWQWAKAVWDAWSMHHEQARQWVQEALNGYKH